MNLSQFHSSNQISKAKEKFKSLAELSEIKQTDIILTKGVFDISHYGHISLFSYLNDLKLKNKCILVVAVLSDKITKSKKGENRPINPEYERMMQIALLPQVDYVLLHDESNYNELIKVLQPKIYVKGMDTAGKNIDQDEFSIRNPEVKFMSLDSEVIIFKDDSSISTSEIIERIKRT